MADLELKGTLDFRGMLALKASGGKVKGGGVEVLVEQVSGQAAAPVLLPPPPASPATTSRRGSRSSTSPTSGYTPSPSPAPSEPRSGAMHAGLGCARRWRTTSSYLRSVDAGMARSAGSGW